EVIDGWTSAAQKSKTAGPIVKRRETLGIQADSFVEVLDSLVVFLFGRVHEGPAGVTISARVYSDRLIAISNRSVILLLKPKRSAPACVPSRSFRIQADSLA